MSGEKDHGFDIAQSLGRIESKVDALNDTISKVVYALLAIVAATVGVEFLPRSPIDWYGATLFTQRFFSIASMVFLAIMLFKARRNGGRTAKDRDLAIGLLSLAVVLILGTISPSWVHAGLGFYVGTFFRMTYTIAFTRYAWCLEFLKPERKP
jgi:hypothetical protein